ncbi:MAG: sialate O-acetylesterase, partial [candidate division FCPU426 bacterium]
MRNPFTALGLGLAMILSSSTWASELQLPAILSDHMVVQQGVPLRLWGQDRPGQEITAGISGHSAKTKADPSGHWTLTLPALQAGGPYDLSIQGSETRVITDVLVGEVWLGSGQSNMEFAMRATSDQAQEIPKSANPKIRLFTVERAAAGAPLTALKGSWKICGPETVPDFSAVAYHFGKQLQARLKVPVGMIAASWGGTPAED